MDMEQRTLHDIEFFGNNIHLLGIHQPPKAYLQRTIQSAVMSPYLFPIWKVTVPFTTFNLLIVSH